MSDLTLTSTRADAVAFESVTAHHAQLSGSLKARVGAVLGAAADTSGDGRLDAARQALLAWCEDELLPQMGAEDKVLYPIGLANPAARMLVEAMVAEHEVITDLVGDLHATAAPVVIAGTTHALQVVLDSHLRKENEQLFPALVADPTVSVADLLREMRLLLSEQSDQTTQNPNQNATEALMDHETTTHSCTCGEHDPAGYPELDARAIPHAIRHATIFGALAAVAPGGGMVLVAPHDPLPLLAQIEQRAPGVFQVDYLERGPETWRLAFVRGA